MHDMEYEKLQGKEQPPLYKTQKLLERRGARSPLWFQSSSETPINSSEAGT